MKKAPRKAVAAQVIEGGRFVRVTFSRVETVLRDGTADLLIEAGTKLDRPDGGFDLESLADLLESIDAIEWDDESHLEEWQLDSEFQQEDLPEDDRDTAVAVRRDEDDNWHIRVRGTGK
jgi:hypothetical protein